MKFKKILSLGLVLGAILSVGMVISAMAEETTVAPTIEPTTEVVMGSYKFDTTTLGSVLTADNSYTASKWGIEFEKINRVETDDIRINNSSFISFKPKSDCYVTVYLDLAEKENAARISTFSGGNIAEASGNAASESFTSVTENTTFKLTGGTSYTITGLSSNSTRVDGLDFSTEDPNGTKGIKILTTKETVQGKNGAIAIVKSNDSDQQYYGIVCLESPDVNTTIFTEPQLTIKSKTSGNSVSTPTVYGSVIINDIEYGGSKFGKTTNYIYAFKLNNVSEPLSDPTTITNDLEINPAA